MSTETVAGARLGASFWRLFTSSSTSNLSDGVMQAALPLLAATLTRDPVAVSAMGSLASKRREARAPGVSAPNTTAPAALAQRIRVPSSDHSQAGIAAIACAEICGSQR